MGMRTCLDSDVYDKGVLLKSVRLSAEIGGNDDEEAKSVYVPRARQIGMPPRRN